MNKIFRAAALTVLVTVSCGFLSGCYGGFRLFKTFHSWNGSLGNKWVKEIVYLCTFWNLYPICAAIDFFILNTIEFWTGSNPLAMSPGESETQIVQNREGDSFEITATQNRFDVKQLTGRNAEHESSLVYEPETATWSIETSAERLAIARQDQKEPAITHFLNSDGESVKSYRFE